MLWDHGTWEAVGDAKAGLRQGELKFILHGERLKGHWVLVRMGGKAAQEKRNNWLLIKERDDEVREGGKPLTDTALTSVTTGRSMDEIAGEHDRIWHSNRPADDQPDAAEPDTTRPKRKPVRMRGKSALPDFVPPQLATRVAKPPEGKGWLHEIKFDGYRVLARIEDGKVSMLTRRGHDWSNRFGPVGRALAKLNARQALI